MGAPAHVGTVDWPARCGYSHAAASWPAYDKVIMIPINIEANVICSQSGCQPATVKVAVQAARLGNSLLSHRWPPRPIRPRIPITNVGEPTPLSEPRRRRVLHVNHDFPFLVLVGPASSSPRIAQRQKLLKHFFRNHQVTT